MNETTFDHGKIRINTSYSPIGKHVEVMINCGEYWEIISTSDERAHESFIALHNSRSLCRRFFEQLKGGCNG